MTLPKMRELFAVLEQQRVSRDAVENLGKPNQARFQEKLSRSIAADSIRRQMDLQKSPPQGQEPAQQALAKA